MTPRFTVWHLVGLEALPMHCGRMIEAIRPFFLYAESKLRPANLLKWSANDLDQNRSNG
jgi:hypothetical protein